MNKIANDLIARLEKASYEISPFTHWLFSEWLPDLKSVLQNPKDGFFWAIMCKECGYIQHIDEKGEQSGEYHFPHCPKAEEIIKNTLIEKRRSQPDC